MAIKLALAAFVLVASLGAFIATRPDRFRVERNALVQAPPDVVFALINDLREYDAWTPYQFEVVPGLSKTFEGPATGPGARYTWVGGKAGDGRMTIEESEPGKRVALKLEFFKPFAATNQTFFTLTPEAGGTRVSWSIEGPNTLVGKAMSLVANMDTFIGKDFEKGLANLDAAATRRLASTASVGGASTVQ